MENELNLTGSKGLEPDSHGATSESEHPKPRDGSQSFNFRDEWLNLEVPYSDLKDATNDFSELSEIGKGGFGKVHLGKLGGQMVAIKILDSTSTQGEREFFKEIEVLYKMQHRHLVKLVGACFQVRALVYEYLPNGSLEDCLKESPKILTWQIRTRIISEICLALSYLHSKSVIHADLKPANVLLDANFRSKLSDFGLCRFLPENMATAPFLETSPMGTPGYMDPWFLDRCILRPGSDLYSLGITVLKLLTGMSPIGLGYKMSKMDETSLPQMIDPTAGEWPFELAKEMVYWSLQCCYHNENSSEVLMDMSTSLSGMLAEIEAVQGGRFKKERSVSFSPERLYQRGKSPAFSASAATFESSNARNVSNSRNISTPPPLDRKSIRALKLAARSEAIAALTPTFEQQIQNRANRKTEVKESDTSVSNSVRDLSIKEDADDFQDEEQLPIFPFERLTTTSSDPVEDIDVTKREAYLSNEEFNVKFGMTKSDFYKLPKQQANKLKIAVKLF